MYVLTGLCIALFVIVWTLCFGQKPRIFGVYSQPGRLYALKKAIFYWVLTRRKQQKLKANVIGQTAGYGVKSRNSEQDMDKPQPLSDNHPKVVFHSFCLYYLCYVVN